MLTNLLTWEYTATRDVRVWEGDVKRGRFDHDKLLEDLQEKEYFFHLLGIDISDVETGDFDTIGDPGIFSPYRTWKKDELGNLEVWEGKFAIGAPDQYIIDDVSKDMFLKLHSPNWELEEIEIGYMETVPTKEEEFTLEED